MTPRDEALEAEIAWASLLLATATTPAARRDAWSALCELQDERDVRADMARGAGDRTAHG